MRKLIVKAAKMLTDCMDAKMGLVKMDENRPEYKTLDALLTDEMAELVLAMGRRKPTTPEELAAKIGWESGKVQTLLDEMADIGIVEYNHHNADRHKQYVVPVLVVGSCENLVLSKNPVCEENRRQIYDFFYDMASMPLEMISQMVPPGGAGLGFHAVPIEKAIPHDSRSVAREQISKWLDKYEGQYAICDCVCRTTMIGRGEGCGELPDSGCIALGDYADYLIETNKGKRADREEVEALLQRSEDNGFMHQITNGDGGDNIFAICNCSVGNCFAIRCSQLYNVQNLSASCYRAEINDNCVACGKCVEVCPAGALKLGQRLCTKNGPVEYPVQPLASETKGWSRENWNPNFRNDNRINCYDSGTAPCKAGCPAHVSVQGVLELVKQDRYLDALKLLRQDNPFPSFCESCPHYCETVCTRKSIDRPMEISAAMKMLADREEEFRDLLIPAKARMKGDPKDYDLPIAVRGTGPAELSCAYYLAQTGYPVTVFGSAPACSGAERYILEKLGVQFTEGEPEKDAFAAIYPDVFPHEKKSTAGKIEEGHEAAKSIHRFVHSGHSQTLARDPRRFLSLDKSNVSLGIAQLAEHRCLHCGITVVDQNRCIGCGLCTTRCLFDAIHIVRSHPEFENYCTADDTVKRTVMNGVKRIGKVTVIDLKEKMKSSENATAT